MSLSLTRTIVGVSALLFFLYIFAWDNPSATRHAYQTEVAKIEECSKRAKSVCPANEELCPITKITTPTKILTNPTQAEEKGAEKVKERVEQEKHDDEKPAQKTEKAGVTAEKAEKADGVGAAGEQKSCQKCCQIAEECSGQRAEVRLLQRRKRPLVGISSWLFDTFRPAHIAKKSCGAKAASASRTNKTINASIGISNHTWIGFWFAVCGTVAYLAFRPILFGQALGGTTTTTTTASTSTKTSTTTTTTSTTGGASYADVVKAGASQTTTTTTASPTSSPRRNVRKED